jgi:uncharacterized membrane protein YhaH (DUF805 family)
LLLLAMGLSIVGVIGLFVVIIWCAQPGQRYENRFGPDREAGR